MLTCKYCGRVSRSEKAYNNHQKICKKNPNFGEKLKSKLNGLSIEEKRLLNHYAYLYPDIYAELYAELFNRYLTAERDAKGYYYALNQAKRDALEKLIAIDEPKQIANKVWSCPICSLHIKDMGAHVTKIHNKKWDDFVLEYSWTSPKIFCDEKHRKNLSENKKHYYNETDAGAQRKRLQSENNSGDKNPAKRYDVRLKISESRKGKGYMSAACKYHVSKATDRGLYSENAKSFGYRFWANCNGRERIFRSKVEYLIFLMLDYYNIAFEYEPYKIEYFDSSKNYLRHYMVDFIANGRLFEVKADYIDLTVDAKYAHIQEKLKKIGKSLELLTPANFNNLFDIDYSIRKPVSFFNEMLLDNIREGNCKLQVPVLHDFEFYLKQKFLSSLGPNPEEIIKKGELLYENKKYNRN